jgi:hypothetical protein
LVPSNEPEAQRAGAEWPDADVGKFLARDPAARALQRSTVCEIDTKGKRADVILDRPPLNVITMAQREQLREAFHAKRKPSFRGS